MKEIPLRKGYFALVDDDDFEQLSQYKWCVFKKGRLLYAFRNASSENGKIKHIMMHQELIDCPTGMVRDHIDGNGLNNQRSNLRIVTRRQNAQNKHTVKTSKYPGVNFQYGKWYARIQINGKVKNLGSYSDEVEAFRVYYEHCLEAGEIILDFPYPDSFDMGGEEALLDVYISGKNDILTFSNHLSRGKPTNLPCLKYA